MSDKELNSAILRLILALAIVISALPVAVWALVLFFSGDHRRGFELLLAAHCLIHCGKSIEGRVKVAGDRPLLEIFRTLARLSAIEQTERGGNGTYRVGYVGSLMGLDPKVVRWEVDRAKAHVAICQRATVGYGFRLGKTPNRLHRYVIDGPGGSEIVTR